MKVALVAEWLDPWRGGAETSTLQFLHHLVHSGIEVQVFTRSRPPSAPGLYVSTIPGASMSRTRRSMTFTRRVERRLQLGSFDLVHAISPVRQADIYQPRGGTIAESIERNLALVASPPARYVRRHANRLNLKQRYLLALEREIMGRPDGPIVVAISDYVVRQLKRHYGLPSERIRKIYNGIDADTCTSDERLRHRAQIRTEFDIARQDCLVLLVAHNFRLKGLQRWMEALALLCERGIRDVRSLVIGKGESQRWHRLAARLGVSHHLRFTGPSARVQEFFHAADVVVHPTYYDPCSRVTLEAMVSGLPCITTRWDGAAEMIHDGHNGYVLPDPSDIVGLADRVEQLRGEQLRERMGKAARSVAGKVAMSRHAHEMVELYRKLLEARVSAGARYR